jgi:hypothetical protein
MARKLSEPNQARLHSIATRVCLCGMGVVAKTPLTGAAETVDQCG